MPPDGLPESERISQNAETPAPVKGTGALYSLSLPWGSAKPATRKPDLAHPQGGNKGAFARDA